MNLKRIYPRPMSQDAIAAGLSAFKCCLCKHNVTLKSEHESTVWSEARKVDCDNCGIRADVVVSVEPDSVHLLRKPAVKDMVWYHATEVEDWFEKVQSSHGMRDGEFLYLHLGTERAAREIAEHKYFRYYEDDADVSMYRVKILSEAIVSGQIVEDDMDWDFFQSVCEESREDMGADAVRYLNRWESPGSISLLVDARMIEFISVEKIYREAKYITQPVACS